MSASTPAFVGRAPRVALHSPPRPAFSGALQCILENVFFLRAKQQPQSFDTEDTETKPEDTEILEVFADEFCLCDLWLGLRALCDKIRAFGCGRRVGSHSIDFVQIRDDFLVGQRAGARQVHFEPKTQAIFLPP